MKIKILYQRMENVVKVMNHVKKDIVAINMAGVVKVKNIVIQKRVVNPIMDIVYLIIILQKRIKIIILSLPLLPQLLLVILENVEKDMVNVRKNITVVDTDGVVKGKNIIIQKKVVNPNMIIVKMITIMKLMN